MSIVLGKRKAHEVTDGHRSKRVCITASDNSSSTSTYQENAEPLPQVLAFDPDFLATKQKLLTLVSKGVEQLSRNPSLKPVSNMVEKLSACPDSAKLHIHMVGSSGEGKSSVIASILGVANAARSSSAGTGCTHVPVTYTSPLPGQRACYRLECRFFSDDNIKKIIELSLQDYFACLLDHLELNKDGPRNEDEGNFEEIYDLNTSRDTAFETLQTLFCDRPEFSGTSKLLNFLDLHEDVYRNKARSQADWAAFVGTLHAWAVECCEAAQASADLIIDSSQDGKTIQYYYESDAMSDIQAKLERLAFPDVSRNESRPWPLLEEIHLGIQEVRLLDYIALTDWPGSNDTNKLRANASKDRMQNCDLLLVVAAANRIASDATSARLLVRWGRDLPCKLICTGIDRVDDANLAGDIEKALPGSGFLEQYQKAQQEVHALQQRRDDAKNVLFNLLRQRDPDQLTLVYRSLADVQDKLDRQEQELMDAKNRTFELLITGRKRYIVQLAKDALSKYVQQGKFEVLFAANTHYAVHKQWHQGEWTGPLLSPESTGIPDIRMSILRAVSPEVVSALQIFMDYQVAVLLSFLGMADEPQRINNGEAVDASLQKLETTIGSLAANYSVSLGNIVTATLSGHYHPDADEAIRAVDRRMDTKRGWRYATLRAFIRRDGCHETPKIPRQSWNEAFMVDAVKSIESSWPAFLAEEQHRFLTMQAETGNVFDDVSSHFKQSEYLAELLAAHKTAIAQQYQMYRDGLLQDLRYIKARATKADNQDPDAYFNLAMRATYEEARNIRGPGSQRKTHQKFLQDIRRPGNASPLWKIFQSAENDILQAAGHRIEALVANLTTIVGDLRSRLDSSTYQSALLSPVAWMTEARKFLSRSKQATQYMTKLQGGIKECRTEIEEISKRYDTELGTPA